MNFLGNTAAGTGFVVWFATYFPYAFLQSRYDTLTRGSKLGVCFLLNSAMSLGAYVIGVYEGEDGAELNWKNIATPGSVEDDLSLSDVMGFMVLDALICIFITWYVEAVKPGDEGVPQPLWFPFMVFIFFLNLF